MTTVSKFTRTLYAVIEFEASVQYLTDDGVETELDGWEVIKRDLVKALAGTFPGRPRVRLSILSHTPNDTGPTARFVEWSDYDDAPIKVTK